VANRAVRNVVESRKPRERSGLELPNLARVVKEPGVEHRLIPFAGLARQHAPLSDQLRAAFERVLRSDAFILGPEVGAFEQEFAGYCEARECVGVASGTAALTLALLAAGIGPGDEVVVPGHTFIASALGVLHAGATPVFCDVERDTGLIDHAGIEAVLSPRTAAVIAVHLYGQACEMRRIGAIARRRGLFVLEDAAQAHGATCDGRPVGSLADASAFSFYPSKNMGALGDGGAVCTSDAALAARVRELRDLSRRSKGEHVVVGYNERLDGLQAALLRVKLPYLDGWNAARAGHASRLRAGLADQLVLLGERPGTPCTYHLFPVRHRQREELAALLRSEGIQVGRHYTPAAHQHPAFAGLPASARPVALPESEAWAQEELSLPMFAELDDVELEQMIAVCTAACEALDRPLEGLQDA
jgi:dTDP-3-amino-3,4,6-trideoxy-alpha-D-glucose transaminase